MKRIIRIRISSGHSKGKLLLMCLFGGWFGLHRYAEGEIGMGILYTCTFGLFLIGWIVDFFRILFS